jgi:hypothetical protein
MGARTNGVNGRESDVSRVSTEIETLRTELGGLVGELDRRRREAFDLRLQARRHPIALAVAATSVALVVGGLVAVVVRARRERRRPSVRAAETRRALARIFAHPHDVAKRPRMAQKIATAVLTVAATTLAKRLIERRVVPRVAPARPVQPGARA